MLYVFPQGERNERLIAKKQKYEVLKFCNYRIDNIIGVGQL